MERPILMSAPLVRATLQGCKTQTRRMSPTWRKVPAGTCLWVKETWLTPPGYELFKPNELPTDIQVRYAADLSQDELAQHSLRSALFLPRRFSRLTLRATAITFEPLRAITDGGARLEGFDTREAFVVTWVKLNGAQSWQDNPEVAVITYEMLP